MRPGDDSAATTFQVSKRFGCIRKPDCGALGSVGGWSGGCPLTNHLVRGLWCQERLGYQFSAPRQESGQHPDQPLHLLLRNEPRLELFRQAFKDAFGENIILDVWGNAAKLRLSRTQQQSDFESSTSDGRPPPGLTERLDQLMLIDGQSDGVRSFAGILLTLLTKPYPCCADRRA
jgi:hypothetical protein